MKVLFLINYAGKGGSEKYVQVLTEYLKGKAEVFFAYSEDGPLVNSMINLGATIFNLKMKSAFDFGAARKLASYCGENKIDIVHTQFPREGYIAIHAKKMYPAIKIIHTAHLILEQPFLWKLLNSIFSKHNDAVITVCNKCREVMEKNKYPGDKMHVIFNGVPYKPYAHNITNSSMRKDFNIPPDEFVFVSVARFTEEKGLPFLIESVKRLVSIMDDKKFTVLLVGDGALEGQLKKLADGYGLSSYIKFAGYRDDIENILMGSNCFINSSNSEALSFAILEALSKALPVIATKVGGNFDIINEKTGCGILVRYGSDIQMARAMEKMIFNSDFYKECSKNAVLNIKNNFNLENSCEDTFELYTQIIKEDEENDN
ncbi:MAG: glycosyltransferase [Clostridiales bacterium]|jgi:glycosyltransferase involved in cell wall biosynthesis|nr:glycosyltransferase [Clostridiales bacterium]